MSRKKIDWESIESSYRSGSPSVRALAEKHGITEGAIRKKAIKEGWARDLTDRVRSATNVKLVRDKVREDGAHRTDAEIIDLESDTRAGIVLSHRANLREWRRIAGNLCESLGKIKVTEENHGEFSRSLNAGVDAQLKLIKGERQAYGLDEVAPPPDPLKTLTDEDLDRKIAALQAAKD